MKRTVSFICALSALLAALLALSGCGRPREPKIYIQYFDTVSTVTSYANDSDAEYEANCEDVEAILSEYHRLFDIYHSYSGMNNLATVNDMAGVAPVEVDSRLIDFLLYAKQMYTLTEGKTNIAIGAVTSLWHECRSEALDDPSSARVPTEDELTAAAMHTDINDLIIDEEAGTVYISDRLMRLDVGALGKGYATEKAAELLRKRGVSSYVLNIGGNIALIGSMSDGTDFPVYITSPDPTASDYAHSLSLSDTSCVTSGDYQRFYTVDDRVYHHIIDTDTLYPAAYFSSVTVATPDSGLADALSTALFCMSYDDGVRLLSGLECDITAVWIDKAGEVRTYNSK